MGVTDFSILRFNNVLENQDFSPGAPRRKLNSRDKNNKRDMGALGAEPLWTSPTTKKCRRPERQVVAQQLPSFFFWGRPQKERCH